MAEYIVRQGGQGEGGTLPTLSAAATHARPGDVVRVAAGIYREVLRPGAGTTWIGEPGAVIDGGWNGKQMSPTAAAARQVLVSAPGVTLEGLEIRNVPGRGVAVAEGGDDFTMRGCYIHHTVNGGFGANPTGQTIRNMTIEDCRMEYLSMSGKWLETPVNGCCLFRYVRGLTVEGLRIRYGYGEGFALGPFTDGADVSGLWVEDTVHLAVYASNRAKNVRFHDCVIVQRGLPAWTQSDGDAGAGFVFGDEVNDTKTADWPHGDNVTIENCLIVGAGSAVAVRNNKKFTNGKLDGYDTQGRFAMRNCTFVAGPHSKGAVTVAENEFGGRVNGALRNNLFILDRLPADAVAVRNGAAGVELIDNLWSGGVPAGLPVTNQAVAASALVAPLAEVDDALNIDNYRPRAGGPLDGAGYGALAAPVVEPPPPPPPPDPDVEVIDWAAMRVRVAAIGAEVDALLEMIDEYAA